MHNKLFYFTEFENPLPLEGKAPKYVFKIPPKYYLACLLKNNVDFGTGFLISEKHILTAATHLVGFFQEPRADIREHSAVFGMEHVITKFQYPFIQVEIHGDFDLSGSRIDDNIGVITVFDTIFITRI